MYLFKKLGVLHLYSSLTQLEFALNQAYNHFNIMVICCFLVK
ncbi:hypothetical protein YPPY13_2076 [Yersinia pestis PY-13]|uniref:Transposase n=1 Tax=Yersinia pestis PY-08 TaxID=992134 RepID=A0AB72ZK36_YERPE|nr:hypothetical protein YpB42003004_1116 [Yersinia pestis biovar Antiqua str. B42003004]EDR63738.1 hypothetical protein YpK1973002_3473 [Yersinia pestis biovar Mediaevalis str. K1973002]EIQ90948.1 hypothetical protein YPPY02_2012 [Yersinia pestis PY-02]EIR04660.1 hypothetical protein YPPY05_2024 [Yersinia pestis PY-05]EIR07366.1 hypothetical protein YPPY06_2084 [Yersinia pestis PY-06]EIR18647.1 hypothetical protein YPPY07_1951 [Yersinia pestis PY-07]EIR19713.1 hypothetical protein YPPY08_2060